MHFTLKQIILVLLHVSHQGPFALGPTALFPNMALFLLPLFTLGFFLNLILLLIFCTKLTVKLCPPEINHSAVRQWFKGVHNDRKDKLEIKKKHFYSDMLKPSEQEGRKWKQGKFKQKHRSITGGPISRGFFLWC